MAKYIIDRDLNISYFAAGRTEKLGQVDLRVIAKSEGVSLKRARPVAMSEAEDWASRKAGPWAIVVSPHGTFVVQDIPWSIS